MADLSIITGTMGGWVSSGIFWLIAAFLFTFVVIILLMMKKRRKLKYNALEIVDFDNGKVGVNLKKAGLFKNKSALFGLWDYGSEDHFKLNDGRVILCASRNDLQDIMGKKGFIVKSKDDDPKVVVPISDLYIKNEHLVAQIAPADFRDASANIVREAVKETQGWAEKYLPYILIGGIVIFFIISMILATQFFNRTVDKAGEILLQAGKQAGNIIPSGAP